MKIKTSFKLVGLETTQHWIPEAIAVYGRIFDVYLVDTNMHTYLCEMTPSWALHYVESVCENELTDDQQFSFTVENCDTDPVTYVHAGTKLPSMSLEQFDDEFDQDGESNEFSETYTEVFEEVLEYCRYNSMFDPFTNEEEKENE